ncbi:TetR family transcriptional regulator [Candidatus Mycobacterium wuenschmannii]|uniref:TetR family transcriptional regulator n=1 Tax=Candidatus Mycobacterium wuenschmannii TaxID=3027808 RepID=A0ABY8VX60_9MYCO|nr:TetR/AcrR family transcriptional regulator [Candidatus Mycobacterium wuenschmannii]WIM88082.1 TetR family transcriptional regulator [Candidatus Mycobacterium wuenschmannii]
MPLSADKDWACDIGPGHTEPDTDPEPHSDVRHYRADILTAAIESAGCGGFHDVHMRDVATRANVSIATLYHHFPSKVHLLVGALSAELTAYAAALGATGAGAVGRVESLRGGINALIDVMQRRAAATDAMTHAYAAAYAMGIAEADVVRAQTVAIFTDLLGEGPTRPYGEVAELLTDVWTWEIFGLVQRRRTFEQFRARLMATTDALARHTLSG